MERAQKHHIIFDPINGHSELTPLEWELIHSPFYQRLRWIKQLGFSSYVFPGAEHSRFGHSLGVMHNSHRILKSCQRSVSLEELKELKSSEAKFNQEVRIGALLHDIGTFPFSHTLEGAYINFGEIKNSKNTVRKNGSDNHEHLGSYIIKNTDYPGGISFILKKYFIDPKKISDLVKGVSSSHLANQILHSEIDCDRMDYLLRDAHYTGLKYGNYDREYLLHHFNIQKVGGKEILTIKHNAIHCVEDFLMARFAWYSQVIRSPRGAKFDAIAEEICSYLLKKGLIYRFEELFAMIKEKPFDFFAFNDSYFLGRILHGLSNNLFDKDPKIKELSENLLLEKSPRTIRCEEFSQKLLNQDQPLIVERTLRKTYDKVAQIEEVLRKKGGDNDWIVKDIPTKYIMFIKSHGHIIKGNELANVLLERDPVKISYENGDIKLLAEVENSVIFRLQNCFNFVPNVFCSDSTFQLLQNEGIIK